MTATLARQAGRQAGLSRQLPRLAGEGEPVEVIEDLKAPFPWFGGKRRVADLVWSRLGDVPTYNEPFAGSLAVLLGRPHDPRVETVNDLDCVVPETKILRSDLTWARAADLRVGDTLVGFDEENGEARHGLRAPARYRRLAQSVVTAIRIIEKPCYRLTFDDGTEVTSSADHLWLGGSHRTGGRGWRWVKTENMVCNRREQRSWVLKVCDVHGMEDSHEAGWLSGILDGEGSIKAGPGLSVSVAQKEGAVLDRAERLLADRGHSTTRVKGTNCTHLNITGGMANTLSLLMRVRPERLIGKLQTRLSELSLYGREHRAIGLVKKEFVGHRNVVAIQTTTHTFIAEGLASHNCYLANFWRALQADSEAVAGWADGPVNEADLHARHTWLVSQAEFRERMKTDPEYFDARIAGWWVWGICLWIGTGWCDATNAEKIPNLTSGFGDGTGIHRKLPHLSTDGTGSTESVLTPRQLPHATTPGTGIHATGIHATGIHAYLSMLSARLRRVRVVCGDWRRVCTPAVTNGIGLTGVLLDPPYANEDDVYAHGGADISESVRAWALYRGDDPDMRIALCGYEGEHDMPDSWECVEWKAQGGYGSQRQDGTVNENRHRERIWFSPHCLKAELPLFANL